jgi:hypothetical protein
MNYLQPKSQARRLAHAIMEANLIQQTDGHWLYNEGFSDEKVANQTRIHHAEGALSASAIAAMRSRAWGKLSRPLSLADENEMLRKEIEKLRAKLLPNDFELPSERSVMDTAKSVVNQWESTVDDLFSYKKETVNDTNK